MNKVYAILLMLLLNTFVSRSQDVHKYHFLDLAANSIELNGADWSNLRQLCSDAGDTVVSILHIGDSHIQAEICTSVVRNRLQQKYGGAGRGLVVPLKIAKTNQPADYKITSDANFETATLVKRHWEVPMGFTGVSIQPKQDNYNITISVERSEDIEPDFAFVRLFASGALPRLLKVSDADGNNIPCSDVANGDTLTVFLYESIDHATLELESQGQCQIHGFQLENQMTGIEYSAIGNNGATYQWYNKLPTFASDLCALQPALIVLDMGTNEAFGTVSDNEFYSEIDRLISSLRKSHPGVTLLLAAPSECQRIRTTRQGKRGRKVKTYVINENVKRMRDVILRYGKEHHIATYDFYAVAGGAGSSQHWLDHELLSSDRIHRTVDGYELHGMLLYEALDAALDPQ